MGKITPKPQVGQDGQPSKTTLLEIIYGGSESPFGGIDSGAPPAYIDPKCFAACDGFLVVDEKLCVVNLQKSTIPTLWGGVGGLTLIKIGTFFSSKYGQLNYALGFSNATFVGPPSGSTYIFYLTAWNFNSVGYPVVVGNDLIPVKFFNFSQAAIAASNTYYLVAGEVGGFTDNGNVILDFYNNLVYYGSVAFNYTPGTTISTILNGLVANINSGAYLVTASLTVDGTGLILTANTAGVAGNLISVSDQSDSDTAGNTPAFYFPTGTGGYPVALYGGADAVLNTLSTNFPNVSVTEVGGTLYIANIGPVILKYSGPGTFAVSTFYNGVNVIRKFGGSLIGLGNIPQTGNILQNTEMIFTWSAALDLDVWSPLNTSGNVTGAGFEQLGDIGDALTGLVVSNNTAFILRAQGISYATATSNAGIPFTIAHIGLGDCGEGAQNQALVAQYDQTGAYVGNTDVFQISGTITAIGQKIKALFYSILGQFNNLLGSSICPIMAGGDNFPLLIFVIGQTVFAYDTDDQVWTTFTFTGYRNFSPNTSLITVAPLMSPKGLAINTQFTHSIGYQNTSLGSDPHVFILQLVEGIANSNSNSNIAVVTFNQEEILFGRDVSIDSLYVSFYSQLVDIVSVSFYLNGTQLNTDGYWVPVQVLFATLNFTPTDFGTLNTLPYEIQVYPTGPTGNSPLGVITVHSPQLEIQVSSVSTANVNLLRFTKIMMHASIDPDQSPVGG